MPKRRGEVVKISQLFEKYHTHLRAPQQSVVVEMQKIIYDVVGIELQDHQMKYSVVTRVLSIHAPGLVRQEIMLKQTMILQVANTRLGVKNAPQTIM